MLEYKLFFIMFVLFKLYKITCLPSESYCAFAVALLIHVSYMKYGKHLWTVHHP